MTTIDNRLALVAALGVACAVTSCETLPDTELPPAAGQAGHGQSSGGVSAGGKAGSSGMGTSATAGRGTAGSGAAGGTGGSGGSGGSGGTTDAGESGTGTGGTAKGGSGGSGGTSTDAGNGGEPGSQPSGGDNGGGGRAFSTDPSTFFGDSRCDAAGVAFCEDFEADSLDTGSWTPRGPAPEIDDTRAARGAHSAHFHTDTNGLEYITLRKVFPAPNNTYFARMFVWFDTLPTVPDWAHWTVSGAQADTDDFEVRIGGQYDPQNGKNLFGVGTDHGDAGDWTVLDEDNGAQPVPVRSWVCIEWMFKGDTNETKFWWDGIEHPSIATSETMNGGDPGSPWILPQFDSMWVGWWLYQADPVPDHYDIWIDEVAVDYARIGCDL